MAVVELRPLKPTEALEFFRAKGFAPPDQRFDYRDVWQDEHARMFVVAKAMRDDVLSLLRRAVDDALDQGRTLQQFTADLEPELKRLGWWGEGTERDPLTGQLKTVQLGSKRRLTTIYDANMRASRAAGRWAQIQRTKVAFPYLWYRQVQRETRRQEHRRYHDLILPVDHPAWTRIYPPNGWHCACTVRQLSEAQMRRRGLKVTTDFRLIETLVANRRTGKLDAVPVGVDPAWDGNPGAAHLAISARHDRVVAADPVQPPLDQPPPRHNKSNRVDAEAIERSFVKGARDRGLQTGVEHLGVFDAATGEVLDWNSGTKSSVYFTDLMVGPMAEPRRRIVAVHNHPRSTSLSDADLRVLADWPGLAAMTVIGHDGSLYRATKPKRRQLRKNAQPAIMAADQVVLDAVRSGAVTTRDVSRLVPHIAAEALSRLGYVTYKYEMAGGTAEIFRAVGSVLESLIEATISKLGGKS